MLLRLSRSSHACPDSVLGELLVDWIAALPCVCESQLQQECHKGAQSKTNLSDLAYGTWMKFAAVEPMAYSIIRN